MNKVIEMFKKIGRGFKNVYMFATDWKFRDSVIETYWTWKQKLLAVFLIPTIIFIGLMSIERDKQAVQVKDKTGKITTEMVGTSTWGMWYDCWMEEWDVERTTEFSIITGSCVIDSGRKDAEGQIIWSKVERDVAAGEF